MGEKKETKHHWGAWKKKNKNKTKQKPYIK